jgi:hypothetical protein
VGKTRPSWLLHVLRLARARGYTTLYPGFESKESLVTTHTDLYKLPEEKKKEPESKLTDELGADVKEYIKTHKEQKNVKSGFMSYLGGQGILTPLSDVPTVNFEGEIVDWSDLAMSTSEYVTAFREEVGGCTKNDDVVPRLEEGADDLFCWFSKSKS